MKDPELPEILYKFLPPEISHFDSRVPLIQCDCFLRFSQPNAFNDPFESLPIWTFEGISKEALGEFIETHLVGETPYSRGLPFQKRQKVKALKRVFAKKTLREHPDEIPRLLTENANGVASETSGILSLSATWEAGPMWAHYSSNHEGICVGFDTNHRFFKHRADNLVFKVEYCTERPIIPFSNFADTELASALYETKDNRWGYEEEYRVVKALELAGKTAGNDKRGFQIHLFEIPASCVKEIIVGLRCAPEVREKVKAWQKRNPHAEVYETRVPKRGYSMERELLI